MMRRYSVAILLCLGAVVPASAVIPVAADGVIAPARYFDLHVKTLRFTPSRRGYVLAASLGLNRTPSRGHNTDR